MGHLLSKANLARLAITLSLSFLPLSTLYAAPGCCSHHGGVSGCNNATNHQSCKDGTTSPTCLCSGGTSTKVEKPKAVKTTTTTTKTSNTNAASRSTATPAATTTTTTTTTKSTKGCCAKHGGVAKCDTTSGYQICKDGTHSATCKC